MCRVSYEKCACFVILVLAAAAAVEGGRRRRCPSADVSWKARAADAVLVGKITGSESASRNTYLFRVVRTLKLRHAHRPHEQYVRVEFSNGHRRRRRLCPEYVREAAEWTPELINPKPNRKYVLFLNEKEPHVYKAAFVPELNKKNTMVEINGYLNTPIKPIALRLELKSDMSNRTTTKFVCSLTAGFPIPIIRWKHNNTLLRPNKRIKIRQGARRSTLVIKNRNGSDVGNYTCYAHGVDGSRSSDHHSLGLQCKDGLKQDFCLNGGTCRPEETSDYYCECPTGYDGERCERKNSEHTGVLGKIEEK